MFTGNRVAPTENWLECLRGFGGAVLSPTVSMPALVGAVLCLARPSQAGARIFLASLLGGLGFLIFATDGWSRYATPLVAPACVLAALALGRLPWLRWGLVAVWLFLGGALWLGFAVTPEAGFQVDSIRGMPRLDLFRGTDLVWYGYPTQTRPWIAIPAWREPFLAKEWYEDLDREGYLTRCPSMIFLNHATRDEALEVAWLAAVDGLALDTSVYAPPLPSLRPPCATVTVRDSGSDQPGVLPFDEVVAESSAELGLGEPLRFEVGGRQTLAWIMPVAPR
jgi:hypothetical protein